MVIATNRAVTTFSWDEFHERIYRSIHIINVANPHCKCTLRHNRSQCNRITQIWSFFNPFNRQNSKIGYFFVIGKKYTVYGFNSFFKTPLFLPINRVNWTELSEAVWTMRKRRFIIHLYSVIFYKILWLIIFENKLMREF